MILNLALGTATPTGLRLPAGTYKVLITDVEDKNSTKGDPMVVFTVRPLDPRDGVGTARVNLMVPKPDSKGIVYNNWMTLMMGVADIEDVATAQRQFANTQIDSTAFKGRTAYINIIENGSVRTNETTGETKTYDEVNFIDPKAYKALTAAASAAHGGGGIAPQGQPQAAFPGTPQAAPTQGGFPVAGAQPQGGFPGAPTQGGFPVQGNPQGGFPGAQAGGFPGAQAGGFPGAQAGGFPGAQAGGFPVPGQS